MDVTNRFAVSTVSEDRIVILVPPMAPIKPDDALVLAAWLVALSESNASFTFGEALKAVEST